MHSDTTLKTMCHVCLRSEVVSVDFMFIDYTSMKFGERKELKGFKLKKRQSEVSFSLT